ncbi:uncharacterized protein LOC129600003 [Paramacrobiotus metropolitanus]|uniref:uncharacterized protein LOC129600003 n=1 Tax=Paramacrobiotus metropolitanus TaxID=2943436 RepID=UPI002445673A|nr:uncharacterized protein LOC129600003 [Paramacrobiotus metropolitanus]
MFNMIAILRGCIFLLITNSVRAQLTTRQCSASAALINSRCSVTSDLTAVATCTKFCASSSQASTALYSKYCSSPSSCVVGSACNIESCDIDLSGPSSVEVPCDYGLTNIPGAVLTLTNGCSTSTANNYVTADLVYSSNLDGRHLILVDPTTGIISRSGDVVPTENITQIYEFTFSSLPNLEVSRSVNVTFHFGSCVLGLVGPDSAVVCAAYPPGTDPGVPPRPYMTYPQLTYYATNVPPLMSVTFDLPSDFGGLGAANGNSAGQNLGIDSPAIVSGDDPNVWVSNFNVLANVPGTSTVGIYGAGNDGNLPCGGANTITSTSPAAGSCCQTLLFSVSPSFSETPYQTGTKQVKVCYDNTNTCTIV